jgi:hypothetical protein
MSRSIGRRIQRQVNRLIQSGALNTGEVVLRWRESSGAPLDADPLLESTRSNVIWTDRSATKRAFIHYVNIHTTAYSRNLEIKTGDVILDFPGDVAIDGLESLEFEVGGKLYVQKHGGRQLAESWDVRCNGLAVTRTVLLTLKS